MNEIMRQNSNPTLKKAVIHASNREIMDSFKTLATINPEEHVERSTTKRFHERSIVTIDCRDKESCEMDYSRIYRAISNDYLTRIPEHQKKTLVIAHAHEDRAAINLLIREGLKVQGRLDVEEVATNRLSGGILRFVSQGATCNKISDLNLSFIFKPAALQPPPHQYI